MIDSTIFALVFCVFMASVIVFQFALALGAPWGEWAMGGKFHGRFPPPLRVVALVQIAFLIFLMLVVLTRSGLIYEHYFDFSKFAIWFVVAICIIGTVMNIITPSKKERNLWAPVSVVLLVCSLVIARS